MCSNPRHCSVGCILFLLGAYVVLFCSNVDGVDVDGRIGHFFARHETVRLSPLNGEKPTWMVQCRYTQAFMVISRYDGGLALQWSQNEARLVTDSRCTGEWRPKPTVYRFLANAHLRAYVHAASGVRVTFLEHGAVLTFELLTSCLHRSHVLFFLVSERSGRKLPADEAPYRNTYTSKYLSFSLSGLQISYWSHSVRYCGPIRFTVGYGFAQWYLL